MILLVTPAERAVDCVAQLEQATGERVTLARSLLEATTQLRHCSFTLVIFEQNLLETEPNEAGTAYAHLGDAIFLDVNFALTGVDRLIREVRTALTRRARAQAAALSVAALVLEGRLHDTLTSLLIDSKLAAEIPNLPPDAVEKLLAIHDGVQKLRAQILPGEHLSPSIPQSPPA